MHLSRADTRGYGACEFQVLRLNVGTQPIDRIVCDSDGLIDCFIRNDAQYRPKDFFLSDPHR
ncbi:hypothetical protein D3C76_1840570 [compost metagenome]